jgi:hypothetical protein
VYNPHKPPNEKRALIWASTKEEKMHRNVMLTILLLLFPIGAVAQTQDLILPIVLNGYAVAPLHYQTIIRILNTSPSVVEVTLEAYQNDGKPIRILELFPIARPGTKTVFQLDAGGSVEAFTAEDLPSLNGWVRLTFDSRSTIQASAEVALINAPVGPHPICVRPSTDIVTSVQTFAVTAALKFSGFAVIRPYRKSAFAIINPSTTAEATVFLSLMDFSGHLVATNTLQIGPQVRLSRLVQEFFPSAPSDFMGSFRVTSTLPVGFGGVNILFPEGEFTGISMTAQPPRLCVQALAPALNPLTNECRVFPTPCDVPEGWIPAASCP